MNNEAEKEEEIVTSTRVPLFFAYSSKWFVDLEDEILTEFFDITNSPFFDDYEHNKLNICIVTLSGKPLFYRYDREDIVSLLGVAYTLFMSLNDNDCENDLKKSSFMFVEADKQIFLFYSKYPLLYITISNYFSQDILSSNISVYHQLFMIKRIKDFILSVTTQPVLQNAFIKYKNFNFNRLLAGSEKMFEFWLNKLDSNLSITLNCIKYLKYPFDFRISLTKVISQYISNKNVIFAILLYKASSVITLIQQNPYILNPFDIHLIINFIDANSSFKNCEINCMPICLPNFNSSSFLYAHISYMDVNKRYSLILITEQQNSYPKLAEPMSNIKKDLNDKGSINTLNELIYIRKNHVYTIQDVLEKLPRSKKLPNIKTYTRANHTLINFVYINKPGNHLTTPLLPTAQTMKKDPTFDSSRGKDYFNTQIKDIYNVYTHLRFCMNLSSVIGMGDSESLRTNFAASSDNLDSEWIRIKSLESSRMENQSSAMFDSPSVVSSLSSSPFTTFMQSLASSSPSGHNNNQIQSTFTASGLDYLAPECNSLSSPSNYNIIEALASTYNAPPCNLGFTFRSVTTRYGLAVCWRDLKYELYAYFDKDTSPAEAEFYRDCILRWIHLEYRSLFPINL